MANQNFRVKKGIEVGLGATFLYADDSGVGINSASPRSNLDVRGRSQTEELLVDNYAEVQGPSTFVGLGTFGGDLYVGNDLYVKGNLSFTSFESETGNVTGVLTTRDFNVTGLSTFAGDATFQSDVNISGASSITGNLVVSGASTLTGIVTTGDDLYVGGSLYVFNDIFYDEITGRNLSISGIATLRQLEVQQDLEVAGLSTFVGLVSFINAVGTNLTVYNLSANTGNFVEINVDGGGGGGGGTGIDSTSVNTEFLNVTGVATFNNGIATNFSAEFIDAGVTTTTDLHFTNGYGVNLNMSGITTVGILTVYENIYDSRNQVGYGDSLLVTQGGKLVWTRPDIAGIATSFQPGSTFYVSENGSNTNDGRSPEKAWGSIAYAVSQIGDTSHDILEVTAGEYTETFPITVPKGLTISGAGQRATIVRPSQATETNDGFLLNDRSTIHNITVTGFYKPQGSINYAFKFSVGAAITSRSPYVDKVTVINKGTQTSASDPYGYGSADSYPTTAPGGAGVLVDGSVVATNSLEAAILLNEVTLFTAGNQGIKITNGGRVEWLNGFIYFASEALVGLSDKTTGLAGAGKARLTLENASGGLVGGNTVQYYDSDGTTVLASGTIDNVSGSYVTLTNAGVGTFTTPRNRTAKKVDFVNGAQLSTAQARFGTSSLDVTGAGTDNITVDSTSDFGFGTGDFTVEFWIYRTGNINGKVICDFRDTAATDQAITIQGDGGNETDVYIGTTSVVTGTVPTTLNAWNHIAVCRVGSTITQYIDGAVSGSGTAATDLGVARQLTFGDRYDNSNNGPTAYLDELRVTKGAAKYTGAFTSPSVALTGDKDTSILLHFDGINGATSTTDDIIVLQDIRITGGNTADKVTLADYSQFGADLRSIACAIEYGNQGMIGDGDGVTLRAISINFNHVGALGDITNDPNLAIQSNEVIELNGGQVSYVSIDQKGDFRVGEAFYVNQETGEVSFTDTVTDLTALSSLTITDGTNSSIITPTSGRFGNVLISGQSVESVTGDLNIKTGGSGEINIFGNTNVIGILTAQIIEINAIQKGDTAIALDDTGTDGTIRFITDGQEAQRITNQQRVGINTTTPVTQLEVKGGTQLENLNVTGIATLNGVGIATIGGDPDFRNLNITGLSTFAGVGTFLSDLYVGTFLSDLYVGGNLSVLGDIKFDEVDARNANITGIATVGFASITDARVGSALTNLGHTQLNTLNVSGVSTLSLLEVSGNSVFTGISTFNNNVTINGDLTINGSQNVDSFGTGDLIVSGIASINQAKIATGIVTTLTATRTESAELKVTGLSTFVGVATFANDVFVAGNLNVLGDIAYDEVTGRNLNISGIATIGFASITDAKIGVATITKLDVTEINVDGGTGIDDNSVTTENLVVSGIATINSGILTTLQAEVGSITNLTAGVSTFTGIVTTTEDLYVGGNLYVFNDIFYDEITGRNLSISGVSTLGFASVRDLRVSGVATFLGDVEISGSQIVDSLITGDLEVTGVTTTKELRFTDAVGVGLTLTNLVVTGNAELNGSGIVTAGQDINFRNLEVAGLSTFVGLQSFRSAVGTALTVYNLRVPENGIVSLPGIPVQGGDAEFRNVNVTGVSSFSGVSTFGSDLYVDGNLFVSGLDFRETLAGENLLVAGVGTVNNLNSNIGIITHLQAGISTFTGITTFQSDASFLSDVYVDGNLNVTGDIRYDEVNGRNLNISGIATIGYSSITDAKIGVATISTLSFGDGVGTALTLTDLTVTGDANLNGSGIVTAGSDVAFRNLEVTGLSTFTGVGTFLSDLYVGGDLFVFNDIKYDEINGRNLNISGISTLGFTSISDIRVSGGSTFLGNVEIDGNLDVTGDLTFDEFDATNANITGIATIGNLLAGVGTITTLSSTDGEITTLTSTDTVVGTLTATDATITTLGVTDSIVGTSTITTLSVTDSVVGTSTITTLNFTDGVGVALTLTDLNVLGEANLNGSGIATAGSDIEFRNLSITGLSTFVGVATFQDDLYVAGNLNVLGDLTYDEVNGRNLNISGIATIGFASITDLRVSGVTTFLGPVNIDGGQQTDFIQTTDLIVTGVATIGYATVTKLIADHSDMRNLNVSGIATIGSLVSDGNGGIIVDGAVSISGIVTIGENSIILDGRKDVEAIYLGDTGRAIVSGITTDGKRTYVKFDDGRFDRLNVSGISTFNDVVSTSSTITNLDVTTATVGFLTATQGYVGVLTVGTFTNDGGGSVIGDDITTRNLNVTGVSTFAGIVTTTGDLYVGGDLFVFNDIFYDEINGRNLNITGVATIGYSSITDVRVSGVATFLGDVNISGVTSVTTLEATGIDAYRVTTQRLIVPDDGFVQLPGIPVSGGSAEFSELLITGISSFVGVATFKDDVYIDGDFIVGGSQVIDNVATENIIISGIATIRTGEITELNVGIATVGFLTATDGYIGVLTAQNYTSLSDERLKSNIETIDDALAGVLRLDGVMFQWNNTGKTDMGVIAQQVEAVFPEIVHGDDTKGVNYNGLIGVLIEAVKELKVENDSLRERLDRLE
ncbi:baseplate wedge initiator [Synechococcus phage ACG-2014f]|uniref:Baseplate wedge initiator n=1 Tax=Synechococcus phage ACG-2014f TaxID=1493511 RepID=A0A0E3I582_9CAUD|nr:baseplate wedge initiator [Synechococcus phage ACG-2014f]